MSRIDDELDESIAFGEELESLDTDLLKAGHYLTVKTSKGSRYIFKVIQKDENGINIKCIAGPEELLGEEGKLMNDELYLGGKLHIGEDLTDAPHTSKLKGIIVTQEVPNLSVKPVEFGKELHLIEAASLKVGHLIIVEIKSKSTPICKFEVIATNTVVYSGENETIKYIQPIVYIHEGRKKHKGECVELTSSFFQKGSSLRGIYLGGENDKKTFKLNRRIKRMMVTKGTLEVINRETRSEVLGELSMETDADNAEVGSDDTVVTEVPDLQGHVEAPALQEPVMMKNLSEKHQTILSNLGLNVNEGITEDELTEAWDEFKRKLSNPEEIGELIDVFKDFFFKLPPSSIDLNILHKQIKITLNHVSRIYFSKEITD